VDALSAAVRRWSLLLGDGRRCVVLPAAARWSLPLRDAARRYAVLVVVTR